MRTEFLCIFVLRVASGPRVKLDSCKSALNHPVVYSTDRSKAVIPVLVLLLVLCGLFCEAVCCMSYLVPFCPGVSLTPCCFVVYSKRRFVVRLSVWHFVLVFFSPFSISITSLGEERANLSAFRTFVRFVLV